MTLRLLVLIVFLVVSGTLAAQTTQEDRTAILKFGIETEVLDLVRTLRIEKNTQFRDELVKSFAGARSDDLKDALLQLFLDQKDSGLEAGAADDLANPDKKANSVLLDEVSYLTTIKSSRAIDTFAGLIDNKNKVLASAAIRGLGRLQATGKADQLIRFYNDAETDPNFKPDLIWALGEMKSSAAVDLLLKEYDDNDAQPLLQRTILEALGKIGDAKAWDRVEAALSAPNMDLRAAAIATLASYPGKGNLVVLLTSALRDPQASVRLAGAQAAAAAKRPELKDLLAYRTTKDPDAKVRVAALQALAAYDDGGTYLLGLLSDKKTDATVWRETLNQAVTKKLAGTADALRKILEAEAKDKSPVLSPIMANVLLAQRDDYRGLWGPLLASLSPAVRLSALRAVGLGRYAEYTQTVTDLSNKDSDASVKAQASQVLKDWGATPADPKK